MFLLEKVQMEFLLLVCQHTVEDNSSLLHLRSDTDRNDFGDVFLVLGASLVVCHCHSAGLWHLQAELHIMFLWHNNTVCGNSYARTD